VRDTTSSDLLDALLIDDPQALYDSAPCGYLSTLPDGTIAKANRTFLTLIGYSSDDLVGRKTFADLLSAGGRIYHETHYSPMLRLHGSVREIALDIVRADGTRLPVLVNSVLERDAAGAPLIVRTAVFDASERRHYEQELVRAKERAEASETHARLLAATLQQTLIPPEAPQIDGLDVAATYRPARDGAEVGGDFYDIFQIGVDDWALVVGDVCGKGPEAAVVTAVARHTLRAAAITNPDPGRSLLLLNEVLLRRKDGRFCTVAMIRLRRRDGDWNATITCGGHPLPLLVRDGVARTVGRPGTVAGVLVAPEFHDVELALLAGDLLVLYTDGVTEGRASDRDELFGDRRLAEVISGTSDAESAVSALLGAALDFQSGITSDDIVIAAVGVPLVASHPDSPTPGGRCPIDGSPT
jgi:sigma-B regulation protein RsbU (phosphoserine phosphatase)